MRRKGLWLTAAALALVAALAGGVLLALVRREPAFYAVLALPEGEGRKKASAEFQLGLSELMNKILNNEPDWYSELPVDFINAYLQEDLNKTTGLESALPEGLRAPRLGVDGDRVRLGFRYSTPAGDTVVSVEARVWLVANETNLIAVQFLGFSAGRLPLPVSSLLDAITEAGHEMSIGVRWYRHEGRPTALMRLQADQLRPTWQLQKLRVEDGRISLVGRSLTQPPPR